MANGRPASERQRHLCETRYGYVHLYSAGEGGVPIVFLHRASYSGRGFWPIMPLFAVDRRAIAVDRLGFGMSDPAPGRLDMSGYAVATLDALESLGIHQFDVVGS